MLITIIALAATVVAAPAKFPLPDGFPNPSPDQLLSIEKAAGGFLPNAPLPTILSPNATTALKLLANNELFEVAFFDQLLTNITTNVPGYCANDTAPLNRDLLIKSITAIKNQEELHAIGANAFLLSAKQAPIQPCQYTFPVSNFKNAILFAQTFTDLALSTIPSIQLLFARDGGEEAPNALTLGSILAQEGQQDGFFRYTQRKPPSAAPFLTGGSPSIAFNALRKLIVRDSCPLPLSTLGLPEWGSLEWSENGLWANDYIKPPPEPAWPNWITIHPSLRNNNTFTFSAVGFEAPDTSSLVYLSGQNLPVVVSIDNFQRFRGSNYNEFRAKFPVESGFANGLTIAVLVNGKGPFANAEAVASAAILGPVVFELN
ncbi:MAG: hypothetical protein Q9213_001370 [Squamulea squamosa]